LRRRSSIVAKSVELACTPIPCASLSGAENGIPRAVKFASESTNREQLNAAYDTEFTDTEPEEVMDSEQSELKEQIPNARPVHTPDKEQAETEVKSSVRESLAAPSAIRS